MNKKLTVMLAATVSIITTSWAMDDYTALTKEYIQNQILASKLKKSLNDLYLGADGGTQEHPCEKLSNLVNNNFYFWKNSFWQHLGNDDELADQRRYEIQCIGRVYAKKERTKLKKEFNAKIYKFIIPISFVAGGLTFLGLAKLYRYFRK